MKSAPVLGLPRCPGLPAVRHARWKPPVYMQNFFKQCQSAASILLDAATSLTGSVHVRDGGRGMAVRLAAFGTGALSASLAISLALLMTSGAAAQISASQPRPVMGFVSTFEIMRTVRSAGFDPLVPPLREGTTYVLRATDFRGILMRVVLDARTGAIRDVTRIVPATSVGMMPPLRGGPPAYGSTPYGSSREFGAPTGMGPEGAPGQSSRPALPSATAPARPQFPPLPLPLPRPTEQASQKPDTGTTTSRSFAPTAGVNSGTNAGANTISTTSTGIREGAKPVAKSEATAAVPATAATATATALPAAPAPPGKAPLVPPIND
jgi:hypothetical protein